MKRKMKVLQIRGVRGLFFAAFCACCLLAGFVVFPGVLAMGIWNYFSYKTASIPSISVYGGTLLWAIVLMSGFLFKKKNFAISFGMPKELTENEVKDVLSKIKSQDNVSSLILPNDIEKISEDSASELTSVSSDKNED